MIHYHSYLPTEGVGSHGVYRQLSSWRGGAERRVFGAERRRTAQIPDWRCKFWYRLGRVVKATRHNRGSRLLHNMTGDVSGACCEARLGRGDSGAPRPALLPQHGMGRDVIYEFRLGNRPPG